GQVHEVWRKAIKRRLADRSHPSFKRSNSSILCCWTGQIRWLKRRHGERRLKMIIPSARDCQDFVASIAATDSAYVVLAMGNIATALGTGAYSCTLTTSGKTAQD